MEKYFVALDNSAVSINFNWPYQLISVAGLYRPKTNSFKIPRINDEIKELFLDSGGFSFFTRWEKYPFTIEQYIKFIDEIREIYPLTYVATMDYPCEDFVNRSSLKSNYDRIDETIQNTLKLKSAGIKELVSVLQGNLLEEYLYSCERLSNLNLWTPLTAIGSICTRKKLSEIFKIVLSIYRYKPQGVNLHAFGLDYRYLKNRNMRDIIYSCDSGAWKFVQESRSKKKYGQKGWWRPTCQAEKLEKYQKHMQKVEHLLKKEEWMLNVETASNGGIVR